ncbi:MAG: glutaminyl-peptide cyclotransferase [Cyclobacteriaceae bacterium]
MKHKPMFTLILLSLLLACGKENNESSSGDDLTIPYKLKTRWKHDTQAFTEGLLIYQGKLYESTGQTQSYIGVVDIKTGKPDKKVVLDDKYFGEGITILNNKIYQLTWRTRIGFVYDLKTFGKVDEFEYDTEGWGLTHDNHHLIMSDGTEKLIYLDTVNFEPVKTVQVKDKNGFVTKLNELEYMEGFILANQWETNRILKIDPETGNVVGTLDLTPLAQEAKLDNPHADVLNGIAYHPTTKLLIVTGKFWPSTYVLQLNQ